MYIYIAFAIRAKSQNDDVKKAKFLPIPGHSADSLCQEDMYFVMLRQAIS